MALSTRTRQWTIVWAVAAALALVGGMVWWASSATPAGDDWPVEVQESEAEPGDGTWPTPDSVDRTDPAAVAEFVAETSARFDSVTDRTQSEAFLRAGELIDSGLAAQNMPPERGAGGAEWLEAQKAGAYAVATATPVDAHYAHSHVGDDHSAPDHPRSASGELVEPFIFEVSYDWQPRTDADAWHAGTRTVLLSVADRPEGWTVVEYAARTPVDQETPGK